MKIFSLPSKIPVKRSAGNSGLALLFDMDSTLYTNEEYAQSQIDLPIARLAEIKGKTFNEMNDEIARFRKDWAESHDGKQISLGNTFLAFGISIKENVLWREELCRPEDYLCEDKKLRSALLELGSFFSLAVVTNNPVSIALRTLETLGAGGVIKNIIGLNTFLLSKPDRKIFIEAANMCTVPVHKCISIGDRYDIDIALPLELGMGGILVDGVCDIYELTRLLIE